MSKSTLSSYQQKLANVQAYIFAEIKKGRACQWNKLADLNHLAEVACLSPHHWHRIYHAMTGETIAKTIRRMRLHHASVDLVYSNKTLEQIATDYSYASLSSFSRAFTQSYKLPPNQYRQHNKQAASLVCNGSLNTELGISLTDKPINLSKMELNMQLTIEGLTIKQIPETSLLALAHSGDYSLISEKFEILANLVYQYEPEHQQEHQYAVETTQGYESDNNDEEGYAIDLSAETDIDDQVETKFVGIYFDDPVITETAKLSSMACVQMDNQAIENLLNDSQLTVPSPLTTHIIPAGEYAVLTYKGAYSELGKVYQWLYGTWLIESGREVADDFAFEVYLNDVKTTAPTELLTEIYLPLVIQS